MRLEEAARRLRLELFGRSKLSDAGFVGFSNSEIVVYCHGRLREWRDHIIDEYEGWPVIWRFGVGPVVAAARLRMMRKEMA